jgi:hypothetical protein
MRPENSKELRPKEVKTDKKNMIKRIVAIILFSINQNVSAASCLELYQLQGEEIQKKYGYTKYVGGQIYQNPYNGAIGYWPGIKVQGDIDNWAEDFFYAIKFGPFTFPPRTEDPRKKWLESFRKAVKDECDLPAGDYKEIRAILQELMNDGAFCPQGKIIEHKLLTGKRPFIIIMKEAIKDQRFSVYCHNKAVIDDSYRAVNKDSSSHESTPHAGSSPQ